MKILMLYTSHEGQTLKIMERIKSKLELGNSCEVQELKKDSKIDLASYQVFIFGSSIRYGSYSKIMRSFLNENAEVLAKKKTIFFGVNLIARKQNKNSPENNYYTKKFLAQLKFQPNLVGVFAGALYYPQYNFFDKYMIKFIMWLAKGDTDTKKELIEYTKWDRVDVFSNDIIRLLKKDGIKKVLSL